MSFNFKEQLQKDEAAFFNCNEFAEEVLVGDEKVPVIICSAELEKRKLNIAEGTYVGETILLIQKHSLAKVPQEGQKFKMNNEIYYILECSVQVSTYKITLGKNHSY